MSRAPASRNYRRSEYAQSHDDYFDYSHSDRRASTPAERERARKRVKEMAYRQGLSVSQLQKRFLRDAETMDADKLEARYPRDHKASVGFLETRKGDRPTSFHLRSPFFVDQHEIQYTPRDVPLTSSLFARISPSKAAKLRRDLNDGLPVDDPSEVGVFCFPPKGSTLELRIHPRFKQLMVRLYGRQDAAAMMNEVVETVTVMELVEPKTASAEVLLTSELQIPQDLIKEDSDYLTPI